MIKRFIKEASGLSIINILSNLFPLFLIPFIANLYGPLILGQYFVIISIIQIIGQLLPLRLEQAIILDRENNIGTICLYLILINSLILLSTYVLIEAFIVHLEFIERKELPIIFMGGILISINTVLNNFLLRDSKINRIGINNVLKNSTVLLLQIGSYNFLSDFWALRLSFLISLIFPVVLNLKFLVKNLKKRIRFKKIREVLLQYIDFPKYNLLGYFLILLTTQGSYSILANIYSAKQVGYYGTALRLVGGPVNVLSNSISQIFLKQVSILRISEPNKILTFFYEICKISLILTLILFAPLLIFLPKIVNIFFDDNWIELIKYIYLLTPFFMSRLLVIPVSTINIGLEKQRRSLLIQILLFLAFVIPILTLKTKQIEVMLGTIAFSSFIAYFIAFYLYKKTASLK